MMNTDEHEAATEAARVRLEHTALIVARAFGDDSRNAALLTLLCDDFDASNRARDSFLRAFIAYVKKTNAGDLVAHDLAMLWADDSREGY